MKSIPIALTWEFWRQAGVALLAVVGILSGLMALLYGGLRFDRFTTHETVMFASLQMFCFIFVVVGLSAVICHSTGSPQYRFTLPVSIPASILVPMINGAIATAIGYLTIAILINWLCNAHWSLLKPTIIAVCMVSVCQAVTWLFWSSSMLRGAIVAGVSTMLGIGVIHLNGNHTPEQFVREWYVIRPLDISLAVVVPISAFLFSIALLTLARRGQVFSMSAIGRWLIAKFDVRFNSGTHAASPMAAERWSEWNMRGRVMPAGAVFVTLVLCGFFLSGRFDWRLACEGIAVGTWLQVMSGVVVGLFLGHVGERFDFHQHLATRPLSDRQLADIKLWTALKSVSWTWITWAIGVAVAIACLAVVGQGPTSWSDIIPPRTPPLLPIVILLMVPLGSWTLTSLGVSVSIVRPWLIKAIACAIALFPVVPYALLLVMPENAIGPVLLWAWISLTVGGTIALYAASLRLRLMTTKRAVIVSVAYLSCCAIWLSAIAYIPPPDVPPPTSVVVGIALSTCILPFVCIAAVPLAIWWNRHR